METLTYNNLEIRAVAGATPYCQKAMEKIYPWDWNSTSRNIYEESGIDLVLHLKDNTDSIVDPSQDTALLYPHYRDGLSWIHYVVYNNIVYHVITDFDPRHVVPAAHACHDNMHKYWREKETKDVVPPHTNLTMLLHREEYTPELQERLSKLLS